jgi:circadian clock protein KaiC
MRIKTGIEELDKMLGGGFLEHDAVMVAGTAGTGKTTLAMQYLVNGIAMDQPGIYLSFEQLPDQLYRDSLNFGWDLRKLEAENKLRLVCTSPDVLIQEEGAQILLGQPIKEINAQRIVVDSLSHLSMFIKEEDMRLQIYRTLMFFKTQSLSSILIWEAPQMSGQTFAISDVGMSFLVDTIIMLKFVEIDSSIRDAMVVMKMRGSDHDRRLREYQVGSTGIVIKAPFTDYSGLMSGAPTKTPLERFADTFRLATKNK